MQVFKYFFYWDSFFIRPNNKILIAILLLAFWHKVRCFQILLILYSLLILALDFSYVLLICFFFVIFYFSSNI